MDFPRRFKLPLNPPFCSRGNHPPSGEFQWELPLPHRSGYAYAPGIRCFIRMSIEHTTSQNDVEAGS